MEICQVCGNEAMLGSVFVFIPGRDEQGIHNTQEIGRICNECAVKLMRGEIKLDQPEDALTLYELIGRK